ncbi:NAD(+) synthase [Eubacteriales bacterium OttesenSCG-928-K08]|nr:NAD(+) synthase [Eubacteriales bacterium OttesenSCG-928-K08]
MRHGFLKVAAATPDIHLADCAYNAQNIIAIMQQANESGVKLLVLPELCLSGYTCGDLFLHRALLDQAVEALLKIVRHSEQQDMIVALGAPLRHNGKLYNCAVVLQNGQILGVVPKVNLPNYLEFYELRHFAPAPEGMDTICIGELRAPFGAKQLFCCENMPELCFGVEICEDMWVPNPPSAGICAQGASVMLNLSASSETVGKAAHRQNLIKGQSARLSCAYVYADAGRGESTGDLVFAGHNMVAQNGEILRQNKPFSKDTLVATEIDLQCIAHNRRRQNTFSASQTSEKYMRTTFELDVEEVTLTRNIPRLPFVPEDKNLLFDRCEDVLEIQAQGLYGRLLHIKGSKAVIGISGGLDSTLALLVCVRAMALLGRPNEDVLAVTMPCFGTSARTRNNAQKLCDALNVSLIEVDITKSVRQHFLDIGQPDDKLDVTYENAQARERTQVLMDIANQRGGIVIGTGDLSELALGFATYNGDHMSMYGVNASVPKTLMRHIVGYAADTANSSELKQVLIDILDTPVSPELLPPDDEGVSQRTENIVGPYELHDFFLYHIVRWGATPGKVQRLAQHAFLGEYDKDTIARWLEIFCKRFFAQQFKRSCMPDGPKVGSVSLSPRGDWRMPSDAKNTAWLNWD